MQKAFMCRWCIQSIMKSIIISNIRHWSTSFQQHPANFKQLKSDSSTCYGVSVLCWDSAIASYGCGLELSWRVVYGLWRIRNFPWPRKCQSRLLKTLTHCMLEPNVTPNTSILKYAVLCVTVSSTCSRYRWRFFTNKLLSYLSSSQLTQRSLTAPPWTTPQQRQHNAHSSKYNRVNNQPHEHPLQR